MENYRNKPFKYLFLEKYINLNHYKYKKTVSVRDFVELDHYVVSNLD